MADRPILFSAPMVRAILEGWKTQTRRVLKPQPRLNDAGAWYVATRAGLMYLDGIEIDLASKFLPGDRLWVREAARAIEEEASFDCVVQYRADEALSPVVAQYGDRTSDAFGHWWDMSAYRSDDPDLTGGQWVPPIHMPRWASRITLVVEAVKIERLQAISRGDAMEEGCPFPNMAKGPDPREWFRDLWSSINGPDSWADNPWVTAITFRPIFKNIEAIDTAKEAA